MSTVPPIPNVADDEDPTQVLIESAPAIRVLKDLVVHRPAIRLCCFAGETLRYTITVQNIGTDNATSVEIVDQVPGNTTYVAGSTTLNGVATLYPMLPAVRCRSAMAS